MPSIIKVDQIQSDTANVIISGSKLGIGVLNTAQTFRVESTDSTASRGGPGFATAFIRQNAPNSEGNGIVVDVTNTPSTYVADFRIGNSSKVMIDSTGAINLASGQIKFPGTQNSSSDPNTLDDYEEGTFTPVFAGSSSNPSVTYSAQDGRYTKIGNRVYFSILIIITGVSSQGTGNILIDGLPFSAAGSSYENVCPIGYNDVFDTAFKTAYVSTTTMLIIPVGVTQGNSIYGSPAADNRSNLSTGYLGISGSYRV